MGPALLRRPRAGPLPDTVCELPTDEGVGDGHLLASAAARAAALHGREVEMSATDPAASIAGAGQRGEVVYRVSVAAPSIFWKLDLPRTARQKL